MTKSGKSCHSIVIQLRFAVKPKSSTLDIIIRIIPFLCIGFIRRSQWIDFPDQFPRLLRFGNHLIHYFCHRRLRHRLVRHLIYVWNGKFILTNPIGRSPPLNRSKCKKARKAIVSAFTASYTPLLNTPFRSST